MSRRFLPPAPAPHSGGGDHLGQQYQEAQMHWVYLRGHLSQASYCPPPAPPFPQGSRHRNFYYSQMELTTLPFPQTCFSSCLPVLVSSPIGIQSFSLETQISFQHLLPRANGVLGCVESFMSFSAFRSCWHGFQSGLAMAWAIVLAS